MAILNYGAYYTHKKEASEKNITTAKRLQTFDKLKENWNKRAEKPFEHRSR